MALDDVLRDEDLWAEMRRLVVARAAPLFREAFLLGAVLGAKQRPVRSRNKALADAADLIWLAHVKQTIEPPFNPQMPFDLDAVIVASDQFVGAYADEWWAALDGTTRDALRSSIARAQAQGLGVDAVIADMEPLFGAARAQRIAVSEVTNLMGQGAQETYRLAGFGEWEWRTVRDARVDPICDSRDRQRFPMSLRFERAHVNCRCWPVPFGEASTQIAPPPTQSFPPPPPRAPRAPSLPLPPLPRPLAVPPPTPLPPLEPPPVLAVPPPVIEPPPVLVEAIRPTTSPLDAFGRLPQVDATDFRAAAEALRANETETAVSWLRNGTRFEKAEGSVNSVNFTAAETQQFDGSVMIHNHPSSNSFSPPDVVFAHQARIEEMHVVSRRADYVLRIGEQGNRLGNVDLQRAIRTIEGEIRATFRGRIGSGSMSIEQAEASHFHAVWEEAQRRGLVRYEAFARDEEIRQWYAEVTQAARGAQ